MEEALLKKHVKQKIEYSFSIENLECDFFLWRKMDEEGFLRISLTAEFYHVQTLTTKP